MKKVFTIAVLLIAVVAGTVAWVGYSVAYSRYSGEAKRIYIAAGSDLPQVLADSLGQWGAQVSRVFDIIGGQPPRAHGSYMIKPGENALQLARRLRCGGQDAVMVAVPQARTLGDVARAISRQVEADSASIAAAIDSVLTSRGYTAATAPAGIVPDSYEMYWTSTAPTVATRLVDAREAFWTPARVEKARSLGLDAVQVATLASIVEEETARTDEMGTVARLYLNRLDRGMKLQADPTVKYAVGDPTLRRILERHLAVQSPYNTYLVTGLPPGPIRVAGKGTMLAVLDAPRHDYLYMCASEDFTGHHNFTASYSEHLSNAARYHRALDRLK